jgi:hypothetical protein
MLTIFGITQIDAIVIGITVTIVLLLCCLQTPSSIPGQLHLIRVLLAKELPALRALLDDELRSEQGSTLRGDVMRQLEENHQLLHEIQFSRIRARDCHQ